MTPSQNDIWLGTMAEALALTFKHPDCRAVSPEKNPQSPANRWCINHFPPDWLVSGDNGFGRTAISVEALASPANIYRLKPGGEVRRMRGWEVAAYLAEHGGELSGNGLAYRLHEGNLQWVDTVPSWESTPFGANDVITVTIPGEPEWVALTVAEVQELRHV